MNERERERESAKWIAYNFSANEKLKVYSISIQSEGDMVVVHFLRKKYI